MDEAPLENTPVVILRRLPRGRALLLGMMAGISIALVIWLIGYIVLVRDPLPDLTESELDEAVALWERAGPASYDLDLDLLGRQPGVIHIEVRNRLVTRMTRDGRVPTQRRTWDYWTVPNQFETIRQDLDSAEDPAAGFGAPPGSRVLMRARFDPTYGYPVRYQRFVLGTPLDVEWTITRFKVVSSK